MQIIEIVLLLRMLRSKAPVNLISISGPHPHNNSRQSAQNPQIIHIMHYVTDLGEILTIKVDFLPAHEVTTDLTWFEFKEHNE